MMKRWIFVILVTKHMLVILNFINLCTQISFLVILSFIKYIIMYIDQFYFLPPGEIQFMFQCLLKTEVIAQCSNFVHIIMAQFCQTYRQALLLRFRKRVKDITNIDFFQYLVALLKFITYFYKLHFLNSKSLQTDTQTVRVMRNTKYFVLRRILMD